MILQKCIYESTPLETSVRTIIACPSGGKILTSGFPGLQSGIDGTPYIDPDNLRATVRKIRSEGAPTLVVLIEADELPEECLRLLKQAAEEDGLEIVHMPIPDYHSPDDAFMERWTALAESRTDFPKDGGALVFCCQYGAGRSGTMAALLLMQQGLSKDQAITVIRDQFPDSIESDVQLEFLEKISARLKD